MERSVGVRISPSAPPSILIKKNICTYAKSYLGGTIFRSKFYHYSVCYSWNGRQYPSWCKHTSSRQEKKNFKTHRLIFYFVIFFYGIFLWVSHSDSKNEWFKYAVLAYILFVIPITRRINITFHAILASLGLILLVGVATFSVL